MKGLSLTQPWASLIASGAKRIETRSWSTNYRGVVAIHASKTFPGQCRHLCFEAPFFGPLHRAGLADIPIKDLLGVERLPQGAIVAVGDIWDCRHIGPEPWLPRSWPGELAFGDYTEGRWMWFLCKIRQLSTPIPCRGALGLWSVPAEVILQINAQLGIDAEVAFDEQVGGH